MHNWKWSTGEAYYKSAIPVKYKEHKEHNVNYDSHQNAINQSLEEDPFTFAINPDYNSIPMFSREQGGKREDIDTKIADRSLIAQRGINPFMSQTSYVNDIVTRDIFLKPINTTQDRIKTDGKEEHEYTVQ